jgi:hypothetical protein
MPGRAESPRVITRSPGKNYSDVTFDAAATGAALRLRCRSSILKKILSLDPRNGLSIVKKYNSLVRPADLQK